MNKQARYAARQPLHLALLVALLAPGAALADSQREQALEARVAELERQVQLLLGNQQQQQAQIAQTRSEVLKARQARTELPVAPEGKEPIQWSTLTPAAAPGTVFRFGGFVKADYLSTSNSDGQLADDAVGRSLYIPGQTPVHGAGGSGKRGDVDSNFSAKFSRIDFGIDHVSDKGDNAGARVEMDFSGHALGNQTATNTYGAVVRHAYMYWNNWLAGQTWSNFMDAAAIPEAADFVGPTDGVIFVRQAQIRYTNGGLSVALENPETTTLTGIRNPATGAWNVPAIANSDRGSLPDLSVRYSWKGNWGTFGIAALARQLTIDNPASGAHASKFAGGLTLGGKWVIGDSDSLHYQFTAGEGIARYIGLGITADSAYDAVRDVLNPTGVLAGYVGWRHAFNERLRTNLIYARSDYDNDAAVTGPLVTRAVQSIRGNVFYTPIPKVDIGAELMYGTRQIEDGRKGDISRLQVTTKYSF